MSLAAGTNKGGAAVVASDGGGRLVLGGEVVGAFPGAAFLATGDGEILCANAQAAQLVDAVARDPASGIAALIRSVAVEGRPRVETLDVGHDGRKVETELTLLPLADYRVLVLGKDRTLEVNLRAALIESRQRYKELVEVSSDFAWEVGPDGRFTFVSPKGLLGYAASELVGRDPQDLLDESSTLGTTPPFRTRQAVEGIEIWMRRADGRQACLLTAATPLYDATSREWLGARGVCRDVSLDREREAALARAGNRERLVNHIVRTVRDVLEPEGMLTAAAEATARALGAACCRMYRSSDEGTMVPAAQFGEGGDPRPVLAALAGADFHESDKDDGGLRVLAAVCRYHQKANGAVMVWRAGEREPWSDDERLLLDEVAAQIAVANEQVANHERILLLSRTDALTGLFNRRAFFEEMQRRLARLRRERSPAALIYVDLDNFKLVNDAFGHQRGDEALLAVRDLLLRHSRPIDLVARLGGDEFAIWLEGADEATAVARGRKLTAEAAALASFSADSRFPLHMSIGIAVHDSQSEETVEELSVRADHAMYAAKRDGKGAWRLAEPASDRDR
ncbi:MAG: sensor domain-containing diguanylate cyclase [Rhodospirillales bacterium]|nr:sensor domain-containing diguanylate cyclase [Rhodospirillales bacterium]